MSSCGCDVDIKNEAQKRVLYWLLGINFSMFVVEMVVGLIADSTALIADSMDMLADAVVYGIGLYAIGKSLLNKINASRISGYFQLVLGIIIFIDILRRAVFGSEPISTLMISMGGIALVANVVCLSVIAKHKNDEVHMRASWIFSANDVIANVGVISAGFLVHLSETRWPDLVIGIVVSLVVLRGARLILKDANMEMEKLQEIGA